MTIPSHITAAIRSGKFTYCGEAQLSNFGETARKGRYVEFLLDDGPDGSARHPFHGLSCGREKGQRFGLIAVPLGDDDAVEPRTERSRSQWAGIRCQSQAWRAWFANHFDTPLIITGADEAAALLREALGIQSRKELDSNPAKAAAWDKLDGQFIENTRLPERH